MLIPAWITVLALVFWGWHAGLPGLCFPLIVLTLAPRVVRRRFDFTHTEFHRAFDVCWVLLVGGVLLVYSREPVGNVLRSFARWLPVIAFPALMAQIWSSRAVVPASALIPLPGWRRQVDPRTVFDVVPMYLVVCLLAASVNGGARAWFYPGVLLVAGAAFWSARIRGIRPAVAAVVLVVAGAGGWFAAGGIGAVQQWVEARVLSMVSRWRSDEWSSRSFRTAIGRSGHVGGSSRIVLRVRSVGQGPMPRLLRVSVFTAWRGDGTWIAPRSDPEKVEGVGDEWRLDRRPGREGALHVELVPDLTSRFLPLPATARVIAELAATRMDRTPLGTVRADVKAGVASYRVDFGPDAEWESGVSEDDTRGYSDAENPGLKKFVEELELAGLAPAEIVKQIGAHFERHFRYTTDLVTPNARELQNFTAIGRFLHGTRAGHCEYFATAATLALRHLGVPARYVTGYLLSGEERRGDTITVRERQAHAWVRVWLDGAWHDFDPTPSGLVDVNSGPVSLGQRLLRAWNDLQFAMTRWWWLGEKRLLRHAYWLAVPLLAGLLWRLRRVREASEPGSEAASDEPAVVWPGADSEWFAVADRLETEGWGRETGERLETWWKRLGESGWTPEGVRLAAGAHRLHLRLRFDPRGLSLEERDRLKAASGELLAGAIPALPVTDDATTA